MPKTPTIADRIPGAEAARERLVHDHDFRGLPVELTRVKGESPNGPALFYEDL